jgi:hypothetical protein
MNLPFRYLTLCLVVLLLLSAPHAWSAPVLTGSYKITENTDLGSQVRITVELNLYNPSTHGVTVTNISVRSASSPGQTVMVTTSTVIQPHANSQFSVQFLLPKKDYNSWSIGSLQQFLIKLHSSGSKPTLANVPLQRTNG